MVVSTAHQTAPGDVPAGVAAFLVFWHGPPTQSLVVAQIRPVWAMAVLCHLRMAFRGPDAVGATLGAVRRCTGKFLPFDQGCHPTNLPSDSRKGRAATPEKRPRPL